MENHDHPMIPRLYWFEEEAQGKSIVVDGEVAVVVRFFPGMAAWEACEEAEEAFQEMTLRENHL